MAIRRSLKRGFTLVELMIVVAIIGVLAALAIYGVRRYVFTSKTAEAKNNLGRLGKDASAAFNSEAMPGDVVPLASTVARSNSLCASASNKVPAAAATIAGKKYQSSPSEWLTGAATTAGDRASGWLCLGFAMQDPQYYMYGYTAVAPLDSANGLFSATGEGDLDGDTVTSRFIMNGQIQAVGTELVVTLAPNLIMENEIE